jgi:hypothetical protein
MLSPRKTGLCWRWFWGTGIGLLLLFFNLINDMCINKNGTSTKTTETRALNGSTKFWFIQILQLINQKIWLYVLIETCDFTNFNPSTKIIDLKYTETKEIVNHLVNNYKQIQQLLETLSPNSSHLSYNTILLNFYIIVFYFLFHRVYYSRGYQHMFSFVYLMFCI